MEWKAVVDRFEADFAILQYVDPQNDERILSVEILRSVLPPDVKEGDHLSFTCQIDPTATGQAKERVTSILNRLVNRNQE